MAMVSSCLKDCSRRSSANVPNSLTHITSAALVDILSKRRSFCKATGDKLTLSAL